MATAWTTTAKNTFSFVCPLCLCVLLSQALFLLLFNCSKEREWHELRPTVVKPNLRQGHLFATFMFSTKPKRFAFYAAFLLDGDVVVNLVHSHMQILYEPTCIVLCLPRPQSAYFRDLLRRVHTETQAQGYSHQRRKWCKRRRRYTGLGLRLHLHLRHLHSHLENLWSNSKWKHKVTQSCVFVCVK